MLDLFTCRIEELIPDSETSKFFIAGWKIDAESRGEYVQIYPLEINENQDQDRHYAIPQKEIEDQKKKSK